MESTYETPSGAVVRLLGNNLLVVPDAPATETKGGILIPGDCSANLYATGRVVAVGYLTGPKAAFHTPIPGIKVGDRVLYIRHLDKTDANPQIRRILEDNVLRIRPADVLLVIDAEDLSRLR